MERTIDAVARQTLPPLRWVIVSDGSTDRTDEIVGKCAAEHDWIRFIRREKPDEELGRLERAAPGKAAALAEAYAACADLSFDYVANHDADITCPPDYYERVIAVLDADERIGIAGGAIRNIFPDGRPAPGGFYKPDFVAGAVQMFRRACYEGIGGYKPYGHEDCVAALEAKAQGWAVKNILELVADHHPPWEGYATDIRSKLPICFYLGQMHYIMREPWWREIPRCIKRCFSRPWIIGGGAMGAGYVRAALVRPPRIPVMPAATRSTSPGRAFRRALRGLPGLVTLVRWMRRTFLRRPSFPGSQEYWITRYDKGGDSGCGSHNHLAEFKAEVLNDFVERHKVCSIIEYGCGDGRQLQLAHYPFYTGFDVSSTAIARCRELFSNDPTKHFRSGEGEDAERAELTLSLDVVYHLVEDEVFHRYMNRLFNAATRFVIIYSSNTDVNPADQCAHVRHRRFTAWVEKQKPEWILREVIPNRHPFSGDPGTGSPSDFYIYERR